MFEYHGWVVLRLKDDEVALEHGKITDSEYDERFIEMVKRLQHEVVDFQPYKNGMIILQGTNGIVTFHFSNLHNHKKRLPFELLDWFVENTSYSYGLLYVRDIEDSEYPFDFRVYRLARDKVTEFKDVMLSPTLTILGEEPLSSYPPSSPEND